MKGNRIKSEIKQDKEFIDDKKNEEKDVLQKTTFKQIILLKDERAKKISGLFLVLAAVFLLLSFISFLSAWSFDQSVVAFADFSVITEINPDLVKNWMGFVGAWSSHIFLHKGFGISSILFLILFFITGFKLLLNRELLPIKKFIKLAFFLLIWFSLFFGFLFTKRFVFLGGSFGFHGSLWLQTMFGKVGTGIFLLFTALTFTLLIVNIEKISNWFFNLSLYFRKDTREGRKSAQNDTEKVRAESNQSHNVTESEVKDDLNEEEADAVEQNFIISYKENEEENESEEADSYSFEVKANELDETELPSTNNAAQDLSLDIVAPPTFEEEVIKLKEPELHYGIDSEYDPKLELSNYKFPTIELLKDYGVTKSEIDTKELEVNKNLIVETLKNYNIGIAQIKAAVGPTVTLYEIVPDAGIRISKIKNLEDDIALSLAALGIRIIAPIPGKGTIGIEVPNKKPEMVPMRNVIASQKFQNADMDLPVCLGKTISNEVFVVDLAKMPHLLMAGATGQGKSVGINALIVSLLYKKHPAELKFVLVDPKKVELSIYKTIERHFLAKLPGEGESIITDTKLVTNTLNSLTIEMDKRYDLLKDAGVRNIKEYNQKFIHRKLNPNNGHRFLPYIVVIIDELADLMMTAGKEVEYPIGRLAQLARAIGIHLILATQRPSVNVITGTIKANFPARIAFRVTSKIDSRTILDGNGADQLIGKGDLLFNNGNDLIRLQCPFVDTPEVEEITDFIGNQRGYGSALLLPEYKDEESETGYEDFDPSDRDSLFEEAARIIVQTQQGSTSMLQRRLKLGYNRAGRLIDQLENAGIVGASEGSKAREVKVRDELELEQILNKLK